MLGAEREWEEERGKKKTTKKKGEKHLAFYPLEIQLDRGQGGKLEK